MSAAWPLRWCTWAGFDPLHDEGLAYAAKLEQAGNEVVRWEEPGMTHDFMRMSGLLEEVAGIHERVAGWLDERLAKEGAPSFTHAEAAQSTRCWPR